ncbi:MAG: hypothetical protein V3U65_16345 [Granulosicoccaceae bacterium]
MTDPLGSALNASFLDATEAADIAACVTDSSYEQAEFPPGRAVLKLCNSKKIYTWNRCK